MEENSRQEEARFCPFINSSCKGSECFMWDINEEDCTVRVMSKFLGEINRDFEYMKAYQRRWGRYFY